MNVKFKIGTKSSLDALKAAGNLTAGAMYLCKDTGELYVCNNKGTEDAPIYELILIDATDNLKKLMVPVTWSELKTMRDAGKLTPGMQYRITDYTCTTVQSGTKSAGHVFDIIVTADDESTLNEVARAAKHEGDTYFANNDLSAWQIWYCLDNDISRFEWANTNEDPEESVIDVITSSGESGLIRPYSYDVPISKITLGSNTYNLDDNVKTQINSDPPVYVTKSNAYTLVVDDRNLFLKNYGISVYKISQVGKGVIYRMIDEFNNDVPYDFKNIQFYRKFDFYTRLWSIVPDNSYSTALPCYTFSSKGDEDTSSFEDNSLGISNNVHSNVIKKYIRSNKQAVNNNCFFDHDVYGNRFGNQCFRNTIGKYGYYNSFGNYCFDNILGENCYCNSFGNRSVGNRFNRSCTYNRVGNYCSYNIIGNSCSYNIIGNHCLHIKFASDSTAEELYSGYQYNHFGDGCQFIVFTAGSGSSSNPVQNYNFAKGLKGTSSAYLTVGGVRSRAFETKVAKNSNGELKIYCEADLIQ